MAHVIVAFASEAAFDLAFAASAEESELEVGLAQLVVAHLQKTQSNEQKHLIIVVTHQADLAFADALAFVDMAAASWVVALGIASWAVVELHAAIVLRFGG